MSIIEGLIIFISIIALYAIIVFILHKKKILEKYNITLWGPALMWRTKKGIKFLEKIATKKRFWKAFGSTGVVICFVIMIMMVSVLIFQAWFVSGFTQEQKETLPGPEVALVLPGINPILPLEIIGYVILALIVAMVVHEFSHGIVTIASKLKVKSLGLLYLIVPIGAFCEPDEEKLKKAPSLPRMRVYAAGPTSNLVVVLISIILFSFVFMSAVQPAADGIGVLSITNDSPADEIGIKPGMIITDINNTKVENIIDFYYVMENTSANQTVTISYVKADKSFTKSVTLDNKYDYYKNQSFIDKGYLGVGPSNDHEVFLQVLKNPFLAFPDGILLFYIIPLWGYFQGYNPIVAPFTDSFVLTGPLSILPAEAFWVIINALYWIFWLNLAVAIFNVLPMVPLDGGYLFNDALNILSRKIKKNSTEEQREKTAKNITLVISLVILLLIIFPWIIKYI